jgi:Ni/Fe-hydrogenase subunit HybB-like protein
VIVVAYLLGRSDVLGPAAVQVLSRLAFFVASPALLFATLAHADVGAVFSEALLVTAVTSSGRVPALPAGRAAAPPAAGGRPRWARWPAGT